MTPLHALAETSARLGADTGLIQAAGGNTSIKLGDTLWVKASGLWLRDALAKPCFVPLRLAEVRAGIASNAVDPVGPALVAGQAPPGLRPSIETTLHALMPQAVVLHVHAVDAIAWALMPDAQHQLAEPLAGFDWGWVPYARPGLPLTQAVARVAAERAVDVLMMANHGLVVGGATVAEAEARLDAVVARLRRPVRAAPAADLPALRSAAAGTRFRVPAIDRVHAIATDGLSLARARRGVYYPDHVVFLGGSLATLAGEIAGANARLVDLGSAPDAPPVVALPGLGMLVREGLGEAALDMLACLADVLQRLPASPEPHALPPAEVEALASWEAEKFRRQLTR